MSTTHHVKMAKASQKDIDAAIELYQFLQAMCNGRPAPDVVDEFGYEGYGDLLEREASAVEFALRAHERGGLFRVAWGMQVLLDPANEVVDPNLPHLELHPKHEQAAKDRDAARAELAERDEECRDMVKAAPDGVRVRVCEGGGPEDPRASLAVTFHKMLAELEAARDEVTQLEGMERQRDACCDDYQKEAARAVALEAELAAVKRQRDELVDIAGEVVGAISEVVPHEPLDELSPIFQMETKRHHWEYVVDCRDRLEKAIAAEQPKPIEPAPCACCDKPASHIGSDGRQRCSEHTLNGDQPVGGA